jgi:hypothetical protein
MRIAWRLIRKVIDNTTDTSQAYALFNTVLKSLPHTQDAHLKIMVNPYCTDAVNHLDDIVKIPTDSQFFVD